MRHSYIDKYAKLDSFIHRIDPRIKIVVFFIFVLSVVLTDPASVLPFFLYGTLLFLFIVLSRIPFWFIFKKSLTVIPFVILIAIFIPFIKRDNGVILFQSIIIKSYLSIVSMIILSTSTRSTDLLKGMERLKVPGIFIMIASFMYRYLFLIVDEMQRMQRAKESRSFGKMERLRLIRTLSNIVGVLFVRSYERAERVYLAMCSRGFSGEIKTLSSFRLKISDIVFLIGVSTILFAMLTLRFWPS